MKHFLAVTLSLFALTLCGFSQAGHVSASATATAVVGHPISVSPRFERNHTGHWESVKWSDTVNLSFRHCQKYLKFGVVDHAACDADASTLFSSQDVHNLVTNAGFDLISSAVSNTAAQPAACNYIAVTNTAITPGAGDTTLSGEIASNGLTRTQGTYSHTNGTQTYTVSKVFTATGTQASQATGLFNASSVGTMCYEATYTQVTVNSGDTLTVTWTVTLS